MEGKKCSTCKEFKKYIDFYEDKSRKDGYRSNCKECKKKSDAVSFQKNRDKKLANSKKYYEKNRTHLMEKRKEYYQNNKEKCYETSKLWKQRNLERHKETFNKWYANNKDKVYSSLLKRRSLKNFVRFEGVKRKELLDRDNWKCQICNVSVHDRSKGGNENRHLWDDEFKAHIDHIIPISRGGDSTPENLRVLCRTCNLSKSDKTDIVIKEDGQIALFI